MPLSGPGPIMPLPFKIKLPPVGPRKPAMILRSVVLPQPDGPSTDKISPFCSVKLTFFKAWTSPPLGAWNTIDTLSTFNPEESDINSFY